jgi:DNA-binding transcriptional regulator YdaS (Cro superfamily)
MTDTRPNDQTSMTRRTWDKGLKLAIAAAGDHYKLAAMLGVSRQAIEMWKNIPAHHILEVERQTLIPREQLRPDLFTAPRPKNLKKL